MGITIIIESEGVDPLSMTVAAIAKRVLNADSSLPPTRILFADMPRPTIPHTPSVGRSGLSIEIGPTPQGLLRADCCRWMEAAAAAILDALELLNTEADSDLLTASVADGVEVFENVRLKIACPVDASGFPTAVFHERVQDRDYEALRKGDPLFRTMDGEELPYDGCAGDEIYPVFVNEAAYYLPESGIGFGATRKRTLHFPRPRVVHTDV